MLMPWDSERMMVELLEVTDDEHSAGLPVELDEHGQLPKVIIMGSWVFVREGETNRYVAQTCSIVGDFAWAVPLHRVYHNGESA